MENPTFSILISTKNRIEDLRFTLEKIKYLIDRNDVQCVVFDDGSSDGTFDFVKNNFPQIALHQNLVSKGYLFCRNKMLNETKSEFAISIDDDAHFLSENPLEEIKNFFEENPKSGLLAFRLFWSKNQPISTQTTQKSVRVKGFVGCGHVWRMQAWKQIPNYPEWFIFYGEEEFASYQLFKKNWEIHYLPSVLVQHRVDLISRKTNSDYITRLQRSLASGWYLYFLFLPIHEIPRKFAYSFWMQIKLKVFKGDFKALKAIGLAFRDLVISFLKILKNRNKFTRIELQNYNKLEDTKIYWKP
jgi:glycosyltransferase involved in cell wall biosynthesis